MAAVTILQIIPELNAGGAERSVVEMTEAIVAEGGCSLVATEGGRLCEDVVAHGGEIIQMAAASKNPFTIIANAFKLKKLIIEREISLVHARSRAPAWSGLLAARMSGVPFVTTYHGAYNQKTALKGFYNGVMARGDEVIANSQFTASLIKERHGVGDEKLHVIYRGVDVENYDATKIAQSRLDDLRKQFGVDGSKCIILHPARLTEWKGQRDVIEAARALRENGIEDVAFILAGDAQGRVVYKAELEEMIGSYNLENMVHLVGHVSDMAAAYALADIVVVASREAEAFGRTAAEGQAMGRPVIATDIGAPPEFLNLGEGDGLQTAWLVPVADGGAIARCIETIFNLSDDVRSQMAQHARAYISENFTSTKMKNETIAIYKRLLGGDAWQQSL